MFNLFRKNSENPYLKTDLHSHLLPGIDDGVEDWEQSIEIISSLAKKGYQKAITTPHIIKDYYDNNPSVILDLVGQLNDLLIEKKIQFEIEAGAEYYVDEHFYKTIEENGEVLSFGDGYVLVEAPFINKPIFFEDAIFQLQSNGYRVILAHPERYDFLREDKQLTQYLVDNGVLFQVNLMSLIGYYSREAQQFAGHLISNKAVHFLGSDIHRPNQLKPFYKAIRSKLYDKCRQLPLLNHTL